MAKNDEKKGKIILEIFKLKALYIESHKKARIPN